MRFSIIIPTINEEQNLLTLIRRLNNNIQNYDFEIIVSDGGSVDSTVDIASDNGVKVLKCKRISRAYQMNEGAKIANGDILYFVHADTIPPNNFYKEIQQAIQDGFDAGCFRFRFDSDRFLLAINSYCTRFKGMLFRGGDQSLFIKKSLFNDLSGFMNDYRIMEDYDMIARIRKKHRFKIIANPILVSTRIYEENSYLKVTFVQLTIFLLYKFGASQEFMLKTYDKLIKHPKAESLK